jgi:hypothetical protein
VEIPEIIVAAASNQTRPEVGKEKFRDFGSEELAVHPCS